ncbi:MAG: dihydroxyacetone kinase subunit DhaL [Desulforhopalus sp.]
MGNIITAVRLHQVLVELCDTIEEQKDYLSELDGAIGDGDHGVNMAKCFRGVKTKLQEDQGENVGSVLNTVGMEVMNSVGGAMGALYGTLFIKMAGVAGQKTEIDLHDLRLMFEEALAGILSIGKAKVGDKTLVDTLTPAVQALIEADSNGLSLAEAIDKFHLAARQGMESTRDLLAKVGRASRLGERTIGHQDAGATSCYFILNAFANTVT